MSSPASLTLSPEPFAACVQQAASRREVQQMVARLWQRDAALWSQDPAVQRQIRSRLGWLSIVGVMTSRAEEILAAAREIRQHGFTHALLLGMGGSSLFAEVCRRTFGVAPGWLDLTVLDTTDPTAIAAARQRVPLERTIFIVSSKSGTTTESRTLCDYFYDQVRARRGTEAGQQFIAITDAGTPLEAEAKARSFRHVFVHGPTTGQDVGGRFSALTCFGLVPAALLGIDIRRLLGRAQEMLDGCQPSVPSAQNPAVQLALTWTEAYSQGRDKLTLLSAPPLAPFGTWAEQLVAESTGKSGTGLIPIDAEALQEPSAYPHDRAFLELQLGTEPDARVAKHAEALARAGHPVIRLQWRDRDDLGGEAVRWFLATALAATMMRINPFDEPNVQEAKDRTNALLDRFATDGKLPDGTPLLGTGPAAAETLRAFLRKAGAGDYVAVLSFLPRTDANDRAVEVLRRRIADASRVVTTVGHGPRYLHSSGQLHKGGPDRVVAVVLTADDPQDVPIPGRPYGFSVLKRAQALGDIEALTERRRRLLHLHLGASPASALQKLIEIGFQSAAPHDG